MNLSLAQRLAVTAFLRQHFESVRKNELNPEAAADLVVGERHAAKFGGRVAGWVSVPSPSTRVTDRDRFLAWVKKHLPDEVEQATVDQVRPGSERQLIELVKQHGGWPDPDGGEIIPVDGITTADPSPRVELNDDVADVLAAAYRAGTLDLGGMLALGPPEDSTQNVPPAGDRHPQAPAAGPAGGTPGYDLGDDTDA